MTNLENIFEKAIHINTLTKSHKKAMNGKRRNTIATTYNYRFMSELIMLQKELRNSIYKPLPYRDRIIREPKTRHIQAPHFRDRIVHHAMHSVISPFYERHFIPDSYACRPNRGVHKAAHKIQFILRGSPEPLNACKLDISKYYASINHSRLKELLAEKINDARMLALLGIIIDSTDSDSEYNHLFNEESYFNTKGRRGIPIGNLTSQLFANIYLHHADMYAKQQLKIRNYVRYMDDIIFFHHDKKQLRIWQQAMTKFLYDELYLTINPHKVRLYPARLGVDFVGYIIYPHSMRLRGSSVQRFKKRYRKQLKGLLNNKTNIEQVETSFNAWSAHAAHANTEQLVRHLKSWQDEYLFVYAIQEYARKNNIRGPQVQLSLFDEE